MSSSSTTPSLPSHIFLFVNQRFILLACALSAALLLSGCAQRPTLTENQCVAGDWETVGYRDGASGRDSTTLLAHQESCGEFNIKPDRQQYMAGWTAGQTTYCQPAQMLEVGERGQAFPAICRTQQAHDLVQAHRHGQSIYHGQQSLKEARGAVDKLYHRLAEIDKEIDAATRAQLDEGISAADRLLYLQSLKDLLAEQDSLQDRLPMYEQRVADAEAYLVELTDRSYAAVL